MDEKTIRSLFSVYPGGVKNVFFNKDYSKLTEKIEERDKIARLLEAAETELIIKAAKVKRKQDEKQGKQEEKQRKQEERQREQAERQREQQEKQKEQQEKRREQQEKRREQAERQRGEREEREAKARRENPWRRWETLWRPMIRKHRMSFKPSVTKFQMITIELGSNPGFQTARWTMNTEDNNPL